MYSFEYKKEKLKFFVDSKYTSGMYVENTYMAVFTYNNIPRRLIENSAERIVRALYSKVWGDAQWM